MDKKLLVAAVGAALASGPMLAQAEVKLYGHAHMSLENLDRDTDSDEGEWFVSSNSSRFGIRASEDVGGGLKAVAQYEFLFSQDAGGNPSTTCKSTSKAFPVSVSCSTSNVVSTNRDNYVGLEGGFGSLRLGVIDTATKDIGGIADLFYREQLGESRSIINLGGMDARINDGVHYNSPSFGGVTVKFQYGTEDEFTTDDTIMAANVRWTAGPISLGLGYLNDKNEAAGGEDFKGTRLGAKWDLSGAFTLAALWQDLTSVGGVDGFDVQAFGLGASFKAGNNIFKAQYYVADEVDDVDDSGADLVAIGWDHLFSKTVKGYVTYAQVSNDDAAVYALGGNGHGETATPPVGGDASGFSFGLIIDF